MTFVLVIKSPLHFPEQVFLQDTNISVTAGHHHTCTVLSASITSYYLLSWRFQGQTKMVARYPLTRQFLDHKSPHSQSPGIEIV